MERLIRERANSMPILEMIRRSEKRKGRQEGEEEVEEIEVFKRSRMLEMSPVKEVGEMGEEMWREMMVGFRELMKESREEMKR